MLCWEGYDTPSIVDPYVARERVEFQAQTLLSGEATAQRMVRGDLPNWDMQCDRGVACHGLLTLCLFRKLSILVAACEPTTFFRTSVKRANLAISVQW